MSRLLLTLALAITGLAAVGADGRFVGSWDVRGMAYVVFEGQGDASVPKAWTEQGLEPMPARFQFIDRDTVLILEESGTVVNVAVLKRGGNR